MRQTYLTAVVLAVATLTVWTCAGRATRADDPPVPATRSFLMGFTRWPADLTMEGILTAQNFAHEHGDIVSVMFIGGIPWPEALAEEPFSQDVQNNMAYQPPAGKKLFLSICPLNMDRKGLAPYWGEKDNQPLPVPWSSYRLNSPEVKKAYPPLRPARREDHEAGLPGDRRGEQRAAVALGREMGGTDGTPSGDLRRCEATVPDLPVCFTTEVLHYKKLASDATGLRPGSPGGGVDEVQRRVRHEHVPAHEL